MLVINTSRIRQFVEYVKAQNPKKRRGPPRVGRASLALAGTESRCLEQTRVDSRVPPTHNRSVDADQPLPDEVCEVAEEVENHVRDHAPRPERDPVEDLLLVREW